ncbi:hypothetical protein FCM35_KLT05564 [Carex littledalei]|uniref:tRNA ligase phosphodiesterase domain-containing protein n=1 Tax=Carex littledalei TaxID=544730 RepID=A0A833R601_9POAL|nr:hypothetical protein FCM35_KLT05564 [Carex littledalei]
MPRNRGKQHRQWREKHEEAAPAVSHPFTSDQITERLSHISLSEAPTQPATPFTGTATKRGKEIWVPKVGYASSASTVAVEKENEASMDPSKLTELFKGPLGAGFNEDANTFACAQTRTRMIEMVSQGLATLEVSLKHSGSLFMYAGHEGGAYAKNSFGNIYTAVGVFVLGRMFRKAWGKEAPRMQAEFNDFLEKNRMCISMELVTAVLGDHGQRPKDDYAVVTAVTELGVGKPKFYSTPELIAFCRKWRLPTNHVWLLSTRKSATALFAAYDALCEEGTATTVCKALDEVADISVPGSMDHIEVQGEILEGLVARIVGRDSSIQMKDVLKEFPPPPLDGVYEDLGPSLRDVCAANRSDEKEQIKALLDAVGTSMCPTQSDWFGVGDFSSSQFRNVDRSVLTKFLHVHPADYSTMKLQELIRLIRQRQFRAAFKCYTNFHKIDALSKNDLYFKMVIHVHRDDVFRRYQQEMRYMLFFLFSLVLGFFVDVNLFKVNKEKAEELIKESDTLLKGMNIASESNTSDKNGLADEDANLMVKLKFLTYKIRTFLIRNGLSILFKDGPSAYKTYYLRQMHNWGTSQNKKRELGKMLDEWATYITRKYGHKQLSSSTYLTEAEPFLERYAKRSPENQVLIGAAGNLVSSENFLALIEGDRDEEGDIQRDQGASPSSPKIPDSVTKDEGLVVFFPGIPGCAKSALCKEIMNTPGGLDDNRPMHSLMGDLIKGRYWNLISDQLKKKPNTITLADKNAPNEEVWRQIEDMTQRFKVTAVPVVPDSEGTDTNPFSLDTLAVFIYRVLQRANHPGNLDASSKNPGYVLLMFYHLYDGKARKIIYFYSRSITSRRNFDSELYERFGSLVKMPVLKPDRDPLPDAVKSIMEEGISLFRLHQDKHGRLEPSKGTYAREWAQWESKLRKIMTDNAGYINSIQVPFEGAVSSVMEQLKKVAKGEHRTPDTVKRRFGNIIFAAVTLPAGEIVNLLEKLAEADPSAKNFLKEKEMQTNLKKAHITLAHKRSHGVAAVASYGIHLHQKVPVEFTALLFSEKTAALEARVGSVNGEKVIPRNDWPHATIWTAPNVPPKEANTLPQLVSEGKATRLVIDPPFAIYGVLDFY